jgi:hypothetical protein
MRRRSERVRTSHEDNTLEPVSVSSMEKSVQNASARADLNVFCYPKCQGSSVSYVALPKYTICTAPVFSEDACCNGLLVLTGRYSNGQPPACRWSAARGSSSCS